MTQIMDLLLLLAPEIQEAILFLALVAVVRDPITEWDLRSVAAESNWKNQLHALGSTSLEATSETVEFAVK